MCIGPLWDHISKLRLQGENDERGITILSKGTIEVSKLSLMWTGGCPKFAKMLGNRENEMNGTDKENKKNAELCAGTLKFGVFRPARMAGLSSSAGHQVFTGHFTLRQKYNY